MQEMPEVFFVEPGRPFDSLMTIKALTNRKPSVSWTLADLS
jgi:hypothetical protein